MMSVSVISLSPRLPSEHRPALESGTARFGGSEATPPVISCVALASDITSLKPRFEREQCYFLDLLRGINVKPFHTPHLHSPPSPASPLVPFLLHQHHLLYGEATQRELSHLPPTNLPHHYLPTHPVLLSSCYNCPALITPGMPTRVGRSEDSGCSAGEESGQGWRSRLRSHQEIGGESEKDCARLHEREA